MANNQFSNNVSCLLTDNEILKSVKSKLLISEDFDESRLQGCTYEFRVGSISYSYDYENKKTQQQNQSIHIINPFETLTIVTLEKINMDSNHFLLLFSKGSLFSMGLTPISTAADPGFKGHLGITMTNLSTRPIRFEQGMPFVKGIFFRLNKKVSRSYIGQHGDAKMSWPYPSQFHTSPADFNLWNASCWKYLPPPIKQSLEKMEKLEDGIKWLLGLFAFLFLINVLFLPIKEFLPVSLYPVSERIFNLFGSSASIIGLLISLAYIKNNK